MKQWLKKQIRILVENAKVQFILLTIQILIGASIAIVNFIAPRGVLKENNNIVNILLHGSQVYIVNSSSLCLTIN
jgi:hypothetical protein